MPYTTLTYATGSAAAFQVQVDDRTGAVHRRDPSREDTTAYDYVQQVAVATDENTHGGGDVTIHAIGKTAPPVSRFVCLLTAICVGVCVCAQVRWRICSIVCTSNRTWRT